MKNKTCHICKECGTVYHDYHEFKRKYFICRDEDVGVLSPVSILGAEMCPKKEWVHCNCMRDLSYLSKVTKNQAELYKLLYL